MTVENTLAHGLKTSVYGSQWNIEHAANLALLDPDRITSDLFANRPAFGVAHRFFFATDTQILYYDTGTVWITASAASLAHAASHAAAGADPVTLTEAQITGLVADLAAKAAASHSHAEADVTGLTADLAAKEAVANKSTNTALGSSDSLYPSQKAVKAYVDAAVVGLLDDRGNYDASANLFPSSGGSGAAGAVLKGDLWYIGVAGTLGGVAASVGSTVRALVDAPGQTAGNWDILNAGIGFVPENAANKDVTGGYAGLTLFKLNLKNAAGTVLSWFTTAATAARTWTMPDKDGTVAMTSDITGINSGTNTGDQTLGGLGAEATANKGAANGYAPLDASAKVPLSNLPPGGAPGLHASTHEAGGSDIVTIPESQVTNLTTDLAAKEATANKGAANGYAPLGADSKVPALNLPTPGAPGAHAATHASAGGDAVTLDESQVTNLTTDLASKEATANKDATGGYAGLTLFKLNLKNAANTITSWFTTAATVARTWTFPDKDGTVAMTSDITGTNSGTNTGDETTATIKSALGITTLSGSNTGDQTLGGLGAEATANKDATGGYVGLTLFKHNCRNAANTITSFLTNAATVARTWTFPDKDGIVAMTSDITGTNSGTNTGDETTATIKSALGITTLSGSNTGDQTLGGLGAEATANKDATGGYAGLTLFKHNCRNAANTITSFFTNAATVARTWTFPDKDGTVAMTADVANMVQYCGTATGSVDAIVLTPSISIAAAGYAGSIGMGFLFKSSGLSTAVPPTIAISGLAALNTTMGAVTLPAGGILSGQFYWAFIETATSIRVTPLDCLSSNGDSLNGLLNEAKGADIASAGTTAISAATGNYVNITGTTTITAFGTCQAGTRVIVNFNGILILTYNAASMILPTSANITTAAGDTAIMVSLGAGNWVCVGYQRKDGSALNGLAGVNNRYGLSMASDRGGYISPMAVSSVDVTAAIGTLTAQTTSGNLYSICWSPELGLFVAVAQVAGTAAVSTSPNGITWTVQVCVSAASGWYGVCWSAELGLFVAVGRNTVGGVQTSPDGITWTGRTTPSQYWDGVCWSPELSLFVAVSMAGSASCAMTSPDGITWTARTTPNAGWNKVCWAAELGLFVAAGSNGTSSIMTSPDGTNWTARTVTTSGLYIGVCWSPELGLLVACNSSVTTTGLITSPDGINWTNRTTPSAGWNQVAWSPELGLFFAMGANTTSSLLTSPDGITWTARTTPNFSLNGAAWSPEMGIFAITGLGSTTSIVTTKRTRNSGKRFRMVPDVKAAAFTTDVSQATSGTANTWVSSTVTLVFTPKFTGYYNVSFAAGLYNATTAANGLSMKIISSVGSTIMAMIFGKSVVAATATAPMFGCCSSDFLLTQGVAATFTVQVASEVGTQTAHIMGNITNMPGGWTVNRVA